MRPDSPPDPTVETLEEFSDLGTFVILAPTPIGRNRALEVLLTSEDVRGEQAEAFGYVNRALPDSELDAFVEALATRIAKFDKWAIANTKRLVNTSLPPDVELAHGWDVCIASLGRPSVQHAIKELTARGFHKPGDVENRLAYYIGQIPRQAETVPNQQTTAKESPAA